MEENYGFCVHCGAKLSPGAERCPECGTSFVKDAPSARYTNNGRNPMMFFLILIGIYAVISIIEGIFASAFNDMFMDNMKAVYGSNFSAYLERMGLDSVSQLADIMFKEGIVSLVSGSLAAVVFILCLKRRYWKAAAMLCLIASALVIVPLAFMPMKMFSSEVFTFLLEMGVGLLVTRGIYMCRNLFG